MCYSLRRCLGWVVSKEKRHIGLDGRCNPRSYPTNRQNNQKYNIITLVPYVLWDQFKMFYNFFFLMIGLSQFIPQLKVGKYFLIILSLTKFTSIGFLITYIAPLAFVLCITLAKEAFDDFQRKRKDRELNNKKYE